jgi:hypothetical protein
VERAGSFDAAKVVPALEGHTYTFLKDAQTWRDFDHQSVQTVFAVKCKPQAEVMADKYKLDYFEIIDHMAGSDATISKAHWRSVRAENGLPPNLEPLTSLASQ